MTLKHGYICQLQGIRSESKFQVAWLSDDVSALSESRESLNSCRASRHHVEQTRCEAPKLPGLWKPVLWKLTVIYYANNY